MSSRIFSTELRNAATDNLPSGTTSLRPETISEDSQKFSGRGAQDVTQQPQAAVLAAALLMLGQGTAAGTSAGGSATNAPSLAGTINCLPSSLNAQVQELQQQLQSLHAWNFLKSRLNNNNMAGPAVFQPKTDKILNPSVGATSNDMARFLVDSNFNGGPVQNFPVGPPFVGLPQTVQVDQGLPSVEDKKDIYVLHEATGLKAFSTGWEAALFILMAENIRISEFIGRIEEERQQILSQPAVHYDFANSWKYFLMQPDPLWPKQEDRAKSQSPTESISFATPSVKQNKSSMSSRTHLTSTKEQSGYRESDGNELNNGSGEKVLDHESQFSRVKRASPDIIRPEGIEKYPEAEIFEQQGSHYCRSQKSASVIPSSNKSEARVNETEATSLDIDQSNDRDRLSHSEWAVERKSDYFQGKLNGTVQSSSLSVEVMDGNALNNNGSTSGGGVDSVLVEDDFCEGGSKFGRMKRRKVSQSSGEDQQQNVLAGENMMEDSGLSLVEKLHISLDRMGELIDYKEVVRWVEPDAESMVSLQNRVIQDWMRPNGLKQQDLVCASGLGASYICYLLKDPGNTNMSRRRRCEVYSVMQRLFEKYDAGIITDENFIEIKNARIQRRKCRRVASGGTGSGSHKDLPEGAGDNASSQAQSSRGSIDSADANN